MEGAVMSKIQIDMFDVQLGSALLIQITSNHEEVVRIVADAGIQSGPRNTVSGKLPGAFSVFGKNSGASPWVIDLLIGTHYDKDHIYGLKSIVDDSRYVITEAWLPPIVNDTRFYADDISIEDALLGLQLLSNERQKILKNYLEYHHKLCKWTSLWIQELQGRAHEETESRSTHKTESYEKSEYSEQIEKFLEYQHHANKILGENFDDDMIEIPKDIQKYIRRMPMKGVWPWYSKAFKTLLHKTTSNRRHVLNYLALLQKGSAKKAINATYLDELLQALKKKNIPIKFHSIYQGLPETLYYDGKHFTSLMKGGPKITILGPSKELITRHMDKIPVLKSLYYNIKHTTPSNELSYVLIVEDHEQRILITGDTGFRDFKPFARKSKYYPSILRELKSLHVIQIAHHGGTNGFFYEALAHAGYTRNQSLTSYHLLSHEMKNKYRPSQEYLDFVKNMQGNNCKFEILFTSIPPTSQLTFLQSHKASCTLSQPINNGDARLVYDGKKWCIVQHAI